MSSAKLTPGWYHSSTLPVFTYFVSVILLTALAGVLKFFQRSNDNKDMEGQKEVENKSRFWWVKYFSLHRFRFKKMREYFPAKVENKWRVFSRRSQVKSNPTNVITCESSPESEKHSVQTLSHHSMDEEGSLTRIVITHIERHQNQQNKEFESFWKLRETDEGKPTTGDIAEDKKQEGTPLLANVCDPEPSIERSFDLPPIGSKGRDEAVSSSIDARLNVALHLEEKDEEGEDNIYDVPPSKSLIDLTSSTAEVSVVQRQVHNHVTYYHTSSPNLTESGHSGHSGHPTDDSIYDTPVTRVTT